MPATIPFGTPVRLPTWATIHRSKGPTSPTTSTISMQAMPAPTASSSMGLASSSVSTPACDNLRDAISFRYKKPPPRNVIYLPNQMQIGQQLETPSQAPVAGTMHQQQQVAWTAQQGTVGQAEQLGWQALLATQTLPLEQQQAVQPQVPTSTSADPIRYTTWGPKIVYYVDNLPVSKSSKRGSKKKKTSNSKAKKDKKTKKGEAEILYQRVILNGSEQMQTTEKIEVLGPEQGGAIKKTWICVTRTEVVSVEKQVEEKDVEVESEDSNGESEESSEDEATDEEEELEKQKAKKRKDKGKKRVQVAAKEVREEEEKGEVGEAGD